MGLFRNKECVSIFWDALGSVRGVRAVFHKGMPEIVATAVSNDNTPASPTNSANTTSPDTNRRKSGIEKVLRALDPNGEAYAIAGGPVSGELVFELKMPRLSGNNLSSALEFELPRQIPLPLEECVWSHRVIGELAGESEIAVRVWVASKKAWGHLLEELSGGAVKIDQVVSPHMASIPSVAGHMAFMPSVDPGYGLSLAESGLREMREAIAADSSNRQVSLWVRSPSHAAFLPSSSMSLLHCWRVSSSMFRAPALAERSAGVMPYCLPRSSRYLSCLELA